MSRNIGHFVITASLALALGVGITTESSGCSVAHGSSQQHGDGHSEHGAPTDASDSEQSAPCEGDCTGTLACTVVMSCGAVALVSSSDAGIAVPMFTSSTPWTSVRHTVLVPAPEPPPPRA